MPRVGGGRERLQHVARAGGAHEGVVCVRGLCVCAGGVDEGVACASRCGAMRSGGVCKGMEYVSEARA